MNDDERRRDRPVPLKVLAFVGRTLVRAITVGFGSINVLSGRGNPVLPPDIAPQRPGDYRP